MRLYCTYVLLTSLQVVKSGQKRQSSEENAPCIKSPTLSSENPLSSDLKSENGSKSNIGDVDTISDELKVNVRIINAKV